MEDGTPAAPRHTGDTETRVATLGRTRSCELRDLLDALADKWSLLVIELLGDGTQRFSELRRRIDGISQRMLTLTLRHLERDGLVRRTIYPEVPPRVEYALTPMGASLLETVEPMVAWVREHRDEVARSRDAYDGRVSAQAAAAPTSG